jgi:hypothetical protein
MQNNNQQNYLDENGQVVYYGHLDEEEATDRQLGGAAVAGGLAGLILAGPIVGVLAAVGAAVAATTKGGSGQAARASGDVMASFGERLKEIDEKHHVIERTSQSIAKGARSVSQRLDHKRNSNSNAME